MAKTSNNKYLDSNIKFDENKYTKCVSCLFVYCVAKFKCMSV